VRAELEKARQEISELQEQAGDAAKAASVKIAALEEQLREALESRGSLRTECDELRVEVEALRARVEELELALKHAEVCSVYECIDRLTDRAYG